MPTLFANLSRSWMSLADSPCAGAVLDRWRELEPALRSYRTLGEVVAKGRGRGSADLDGRDEVLRAMLRLAPTDAEARLAMLHVLAPGLTQVAKAYVGRWGWPEAESMVAASAVERIVGFGDRRSVRPAVNIVLGVRHDLFERALREDSRQRFLGEQVPLSDEHAEVDRQGAGEELLGLIGEGVRLGAITPRGARLIALHRIYGVSTRDVATAEGRDAAAVRKYRNRAEAALAEVAMEVA